MSKYLPLLLALAVPAAAQSSGRIVVGKNAMVSADKPQNEQGEAVICASPTDPNLLIAAATTTSHGGQFQASGEVTFEMVYYSRDGGKTWHFAFDTFDKNFSPDPACAYGPDGAAHFTTMAGAAKAGDDYADNPIKLLSYRSPDGGKTWDPPVELTGVVGADRQYMIFDNTGGKFQGRYYVGYDGSFHQRTLSNAKAGGKQLYGLSRSLDGGKTWDLPATRNADALFHNGNLALLSDGTILSVLGVGKPRDPARPCPQGQKCPDATVDVIVSPPGGDLVGTTVRVADMYRGSALNTHMINSIAVDASAAYRDRIYVTWNDDRSGRFQPLLSYSADRGKSWSTPRSVSDSKPVDIKDYSKGPHDTAPWVAVNKDGVVGVIWLDRRDVKDQLGYDLRFSASLDGGETWLPSVKVSEAPMRARMLWSMGPYHFIYRANPDTISARLGGPWWDYSGGDATFMTADAAGNFHPIWADARTGVRHEWTSSITVNGSVVPQRPIIAAAAAVTKSIALEFIPGTQVYDSVGHTVQVDARLKNTGSEVVRGPLVARVTALTTKVADLVRITNSDNAQSTVGAEWDFTSLLADGALKPGETTGAKRLRFQFDGMQPLDYRSTVGEYFGSGYLELRLVVRGGGELKSAERK